MRHCNHPGPCCACRQRHPVPRSGVGYCAADAAMRQALIVLACALGLLSLFVYAVAAAR